MLFRTAIRGNWSWKQVLEKMKIGDDGEEWTIDEFMAIFHEADVNGDKSLSIDELRHHLKNTHQIGLSDFQLKALFTAADEDGNNEVDEEEWRILGTKLLS